MKYIYTTAQFKNVTKRSIEYFENGDEIYVKNSITGIEDVYIVHTKKVLIKKLR